MEWKITKQPVAYEEAVSFMENRVAEIHAGTKPEMVWLVEHEPLYTAGTSADEADLVEPDKFPVHKTGRGGQYTYHGPGQRVAYVMLDLKTHGRDIKKYVCNLEQWLINSLAAVGVVGMRRTGRVGIWVDMGGGRESKIAAVGVRLRKWVTYHGISLNINPDLSHFNGIVPCGISEHGVTSLAQLGKNISMAEMDKILKEEFGKIFGEV